MLSWDMGIKRIDRKDSEVVSHLSNGPLWEGMTAMCLETLILPRCEVVHEYLERVELKLLEG
jgi:hypothetical protein